MEQNNKYNIDELVSSIDFNKNKYRKVNDNLILTNYQYEVLKKMGINVDTATSLSQIIFEAEEVYEDTLDEELDQVLYELSERNYYENTNK